MYQYPLNPVSNIDPEGFAVLVATGAGMDAGATIGSAGGPVGAGIGAIVGTGIGIGLYLWATSDFSDDSAAKTDTITKCKEKKLPTL